MSGTKVICFANNKGGSGKSTTCSNVGFGLTLLGKKVLLVDGDMQLNLSLSLFEEDQVLAFARSEKNLYEGIKKQSDLTDFIVHSSFENLAKVLTDTSSESWQVQDAFDEFATTIVKMAEGIYFEKMPGKCDFIRSI